MCYLRDAVKKNYLDREIVPMPSDTPTIETVSEYLDKLGLSWAKLSSSWD